MKKILTVALLCGLLVFLISPAVFANAPGPNMDGTFERNFGDRSRIMWIAVICICLLYTPFTCWVEWLVSGPFGLRGSYQKTIFITNLISQLSMHFLEVLIMSFAPRYVQDSIYWYALVVLVLEVLVYLSEFLVYRKKMTGVSGKRILLYTLCANTASLLGGLLLTIFIL